MSRYKETFNTWDKQAKIYQDKFMVYDLYNDTYDTFLESLNNRQNSKVLEIGCGPGNITKYLLTKSRELDITAIDVSPKMIELAKHNNPSAQCLVMDAREISKLNKLYDAIICGFCIPYLNNSDCLKLIEDCNNLLSKSGILYLSFVEGNYTDSGYLIGFSGDRVYFCYHNLELLQKNLKTNSFEVEQIIHKRYMKVDKKEEVHTIIIARKKL